MDFNSLETETPFTHCCSCHCEFATTEITYMVQKSYVGDECIFEYAICQNCREAISTEFSEKSREAMFDFFHDNADLDEKMRQVPYDATIKEHIQKCITCSTPRSKCKSYSYAGHFLDDFLLPGPFPIMICGTCEESLSNSLSKETRESWNRFIEENFPGPPSESKPIPNHGKPILI